MGTISALGQLFCIDPANVKGMKSTSFIAPSDWECQSRKEAEPWPCPKGVSSYCRYYDDERSTSRRATTALGGTDFADASDAVLAEVDDMCVRYYCYGLGANGKWSSYPPWNPGDFTDSCCEQFTHFETKVLSNATLTILGEASGTELGAFTDPGSSGWNAKVATVCGAHDDSTSITNWFKDSYWGYRHWHEDPNVEKHLIHFEINRFEMGPVCLSRGPSARGVLPCSLWLRRGGGGHEVLPEVAVPAHAAYPGWTCLLSAHVPGRQGQRTPLL